MQVPHLLINPFHPNTVIGKDYLPGACCHVADTCLSLESIANTLCKAHLTRPRTCFILHAISVTRSTGKAPQGKYLPTLQLPTKRLDIEA